MCALELVAWLAGEEHSDHPECTCPILGAVVRTFNDLVPDGAARDRYVRPLVPKLVRTTASLAIERERAFLAADCAVRFFAPLALARAGEDAAAQAARGLPPIVDVPSAQLAADALAPLGAPVRAAQWTASWAASGRPARAWVSGTVHAARVTQCWQGVRRLVESMIAVGQPVHR